MDAAKLVAAQFPRKVLVSQAGEAEWVGVCHGFAKRPHGVILAIVVRVSYGVRLYIDPSRLTFC